MVITWGFHSRNSGSSPDIGISPLFKIQIVIWFNLSIVKRLRIQLKEQFDSVAQSVEHSNVNRAVGGSIPSRVAKEGGNSSRSIFLDVGNFNKSIMFLL